MNFVRTKERAGMRNYWTRGSLERDTTKPYPKEVTKCIISMDSLEGIMTRPFACVELQFSISSEL